MSKKREVEDFVYKKDYDAKVEEMALDGYHVHTVHWNERMGIYRIVFRLGPKIESQHSMVPSDATAELTHNTSNFKKVEEFHRAFGVTMGNYDMPQFVDVELRKSLINEEVREVMKAFKSGDLRNLAKELSDLLYVVYGTGVALGLELDKAFDLVHNSNMSKLGDDGKPVIRDDGKILKGPKYQEPDMSSIAHAKPRKKPGPKPKSEAAA